MSYTIQYMPPAAKALRKMDKAVAVRIFEKIEALATAPYESAGVKALAGSLKGLYRLRVGDYRVLYEINNDTVCIIVLDIDNRKDIYKQ